MFLKNNILASNLFSSYNKSLINQNKSINKISSGIKINSSKDNPLGMQKSENLRNRIRTLEMSQKNIQESTSFIQTVDSSLQEISTSLSNIKKLIVQSGNGTLSNDELKSIQKEIEENIKFIEDATKVQFNGKDIFDNGASMTVCAGDTNLEFPTENLTNDIKNLKTIDILNSTDNIQKIEDTLKKVNNLRVDYGALQNSLEVIFKTNEQNISINEKIDSKIRDTDLSLEIIEFSKESMLVDAKLSMMAQINDIPQNILDAINR